MPSSGVLSGSLNQIRLPRGTTRIPIASSAFLTNITVIGDTFQIATLDEFILDTVLKPSASLNDVPYTVQLFNETTGLVLQSFDCKVSPVSAPDDQSYLFTLNVVDVTHFYSLRIVATQGGNPDFIMSLSGPTFTMVISSLTSTGGGAPISATPPIFVVANNITLGAPGSNATSPTTPDAASSVTWSPFDAAHKALVLQGKAGQATSLQEWQSSAGAILAEVDSTGNILIAAANRLDTTAAGVLNLGTTNATAAGIGNPAGGLSTFQVFINQGGASLHGSNAGLQFSSTTANRAGARFNQYGANAGVPGITGFKSRGATVGSLASVADGDVLARMTAIGVAADNVSIPLAGFVSIQVPVGGTNANWVATDFSVSLVPLAGPINSNRQVFKITSEVAADFINGTTAPVTVAGHGAIRYNNATPAFEVSLNTGAWTALITAATGLAFSAITTGVNTTATMTVGAGASMKVAPGGVFGLSTIGVTNVVVGDATTGVSLTVGTNNTFVGAGSGAAATTGGGNTFLGYFSGNAVTTASGNTLIGGSAGQFLTTGGSNTVVGDAALSVATTSALNVVIGNSAMPFAGTGSQNISIGSSTMAAATNPNLNVVIGDGAAATLIDDIGSVIIGATAGGGALTGTTKSVFIGFGAGAPTTGASNTFVGYASGIADTTGAFNVCMGANVAAALTTGSNNVVIGAVANVATAATANAVVVGEASVVPSGGTVVGSAAGKAAATAARLTAIGHLTAASITAGDDNTFIGDSAGTLVTTGTLNTFVGSGAGAAMTTGATAVAVGYQAGATITTGVGNTLIGVQTGNGITAAGENTAVGNQAYKFGTGASNTAIGSKAFNNAAATGTFNTVVGETAAQTLTTGNNNVILGRQADVNGGGTGGATATAIIVGSGTTGSSASVIIATGAASTTTNDLIVASGDTGISRGSAGILRVTKGTAALATDGTIQAAGQIQSGVTTTAGAYVVTVFDYIILANAAGGAFAVTLPAANAHKQIVIVKKTDATANAVTITAAGADTIDGVATKAITVQYTAYMMISDGVSNWNIF